MIAFLLFIFIFVFYFLLLMDFITVLLQHHSKKGPASSRPVPCVTTVKTGPTGTLSHPTVDLLAG